MGGSDPRPPPPNSGISPFSRLIVDGYGNNVDSGTQWVV